MSVREFSMRLNCTYKGNTNTIENLDVEHKVDEKWQTLDLNIASPGFEVFVYAMFACQHTYFRTNCTECGLVLNSATGNILVGADNDWNMELLLVHFSGLLGSGQASQDDIDYIVSRMKQCPVSLNIKNIPDARSTVTLKRSSADSPGQDSISSDYRSARDIR